MKAWMDCVTIPDKVAETELFIFKITKPFNAGNYFVQCVFAKRGQTKEPWGIWVARGDEIVTKFKSRDP